MKSASQGLPFSRRPQLASMACSKSTMISRPLSWRKAMVSSAIRRFSSGVVSSDSETSSRRDLTTITATGMRCLWLTMNWTSGQCSTFVPRPRVLPKRARRIAPVSTDPRAVVMSATKRLAPAKPTSAYRTPKLAMRCSRPTALGTEISMFGCCIPSRRLVSNSSTFLAIASFICPSF